eukprot:TRINITY_DN16931_c0_g1_i1.p1 TRINITY_DN16931_c0_g1~~TRINITY_DN16931_c0_g1_i1.p1  ORF type:complete len:423 (+),score=90.65 TRINITY_DN16931_c0_g1_i1:228-1496(+)
MVDFTIIADQVKSYTFNPRYLPLVACFLLAFEVLFSTLVVRHIPYTEIDWIAYMQEVGGPIEDGEYDYTQLRGDTGPLVYPAGFMYIYAVLYFITVKGKNILLGQYLFIALYIAFLAVVFAIYHEVNRVRKTPLISPWVLVLLCVTKRIHSIFMLRLFNDCFAMLFAYAAIWMFTKDRWSWGCVLFSLGVSVKMNILLFAPGLLLLLLKRFGVLGTIPKLSICAAIQVALAVPFLRANAWGYMVGSFNFGRQFFHIWTVNLKFVPEEIFLSKPLATSLLAAQLLCLFVFAAKKWTQSEGGLWRAVREWKEKPALSAEHIVAVMFTSNFIGIVFARSLHYQFYVWYWHTLPFLLWKTALPVPVRLVLLAAVEWVWNVYPSNSTSSITLQVCHLVLLVSLLLSPKVEASREVEEENDLNRKKRR